MKHFHKLKKNLNSEKVSFVICNKGEALKLLQTPLSFFSTAAKSKRLKIKSQFENGLTFVLDDDVVFANIENSAKICSVLKAKNFI